MSKPSIPQGTRDFNAGVVQKRNYIFHTIRSVFELYGFQPLETPSMENLDTLMGKYGEEGDKLIFKILNNGLDNPTKKEQAIADFDKILEGKNSKGITERALRYDLTIPFARYVAMNYGQLTLPFKRYQIQPVWRADRPQKGRYREFYQCDADVVGSQSLLNEIELTNLYAAVFEKLHLPVEIRINSRKILAALAAICGGLEMLIPITIAIDKLDKIGLEKVKEELLNNGLTTNQINTIEKYLLINGTNDQKIIQIKNLLGDNEMGKSGIAELEHVLNNAQLISPKSSLIIDLTLARGLNYYTGIIFEVKAIGAQMGSIGGGGRYDDLTGLFGVPNVPGVGISFGVDRIYDVLEELQLFPDEVQKGTKVLFFNLGEAESKKAYELMQQLRNHGIASELFHENTKLDKQFKYAEKKAIPFVIILGTKELAEGTCNIKNIQTGEQKTILQNELAQQLF
ncbi:MAG: histidine--tRNA ligase [Sphingobacteriia bacterium]|nr:MAG: histidine--tRNA ligase [Sphingobacteriia bacterium]